MKMLHKLIFTLLLIAALTISATAKDIVGSGETGYHPGRPPSEHRVTNRDVARAEPGDRFWRNNNGIWGWYTVNLGDINYAKARNRGESGFMEGFTPSLPDVDESGEKFMGYQKTDDHKRRLYDSGKIEDIITRETEFSGAFAALRELYNVPIPRRNASLRGATNEYRTNDVPRDFPRTYWASITLEGRIMRVIIANDPQYRLRVSYWVQEDFIRDFPNASWSWKGEDVKHSPRSGKIQEDLSDTLKFVEFEK